MRGQFLLISVLFTTATVAQESHSGTGTAQTTQMATPPPVSGVNYATQVGSEVRSNYLRGGLAYTTSYIDSFMPESGTTPIAETTMSVIPTIEFDTTTVRHHAVMTYSPGFTFYRPSSAMNEVDNTAGVDYSFRLTEHATISVVERFQDSSSPFSAADADVGVVSGAPVSTTPGVTPPFAKRLTNSVTAQITAQTGLNEMIGASGLTTLLHYPSSSETPGLYDSSSRGGTAFYNHRISALQYLGVTYQYMDMLTTPAGSESATKTSTVMGYYTVYLRPQLSLSVSGGTQYYQMANAPAPVMSGWGRPLSASMGWQGDRASLAASYAQSITGAGGLSGAFNTRSANAAVRWRLARTWTAGTSGSYSINKAISGMVQTTSAGGHTLSGSATLQHPIGRQVSLAFDYDRIHQSYGEVAAIAANPDSDRISVSINWNFLRPLGR